MYIKNTQCLLLNLLEAYLILSVVNFFFFFVFVILNKLTSNQYDENLYIYIYYSYTLYSIDL